MKITLDLPSLAIGGLAAAALAMTMSAAQVRHSATGPQMSGPNEVWTGGPQARPFARDLVYLEDGDTFTVPVGRIFVIVGIGTRNPAIPSLADFRVFKLFINGAQENGTYRVRSLVQGLGSGRPIPENTTVQIMGDGPTNAGKAFLTGYLEDA